MKCHPNIEKQLSHVNARLADAIELLNQSATSIKIVCTVIAELQNAIEDIYIALGNTETTDTELE